MLYANNINRDIFHNCTKFAAPMLDTFKTKYSTLILSKVQNILTMQASYRSTELHAHKTGFLLTKTHIRGMLIQHFLSSSSFTNT